MCLICVPPGPSHLCGPAPYASVVYNTAPVVCPAPLTASLVLSSRFENIEVAERVLRDLCERAGCNEEDLRPLLSALWEALANAIRHGNRRQADRRVLVEYAVDDDAAVITVYDQGEGFDPDTVPDPTAPENLLRPSGRGIFFMKQLMDRVEFTSPPAGGTCVTMKRRLNSTVRSADNEE
jgi:serine/threonine-protein kinase RsbW